MRKRYTFSCGLIIRIAYPAVLDEQEIVAAADSALKDADIPVIWNLRKGVRISSAAERNLLPQGKFGIPHALLRPKELEAELLYHADNHQEEIREYLFPAAVDPYRPAMRERYAGRNRLLLSTEEELLIWHEEKHAVLPLRRIRYGERKHAEGVFREARRSAKRSGSPAALLIQPDSPAETASLCGIIASVAARFRPEWLELPELLSTALELSGDNENFPRACRSNPLPADPLNRFRRSIPWEQPSEGRLFLLARTHRGDSAGFAESSPPRRGLHAAMPGEVLMQEEKLRLRFDRGELAEIRGTPDGSLLCGPSRPYLLIDGEEIRPMRVGTFSFQDDPIRGMRDTLEFNSPRFEAPGRLVRDYFFLAEDSRLCISYFAHYPQIKQGTSVEEYGLSELPLMHLGEHESLRVRCAYPDGNGSVVELHEEGTYLLYGCRFSFITPAGEFSLEFGEYQEVVHELPVAVRLRGGEKRRRGRSGDRLVLINPGGSYTPCTAEAMSGIQEQFSLVIDLNGERAPMAPLLPYLEQYRVSL